MKRKDLLGMIVFAVVFVMGVDFLTRPDAETIEQLQAAGEETYEVKQYLAERSTRLQLKSSLE